MGLARAEGAGARAIAADIGTSEMPRASSVAAQRAICSTLIGNAVATPTAPPWRRAWASSRASATSIASAVGAASSTTSAAAAGRFNGRGDFAGEAARRGAVVEIVEAARRDLGQNGRKGAGIGGELAAEIVRDPDIAGKSRHQPMQRFQVLGFGGRGRQRVRAGIGGRIAERLHRRLQQHFVARLARPRRVALEVGAVRGEGERNGGGKLGDRGDRAFLVEAESADHDGDARRAFEFRAFYDRPRVDVGRPRAVGADARQQAEMRFLDEPLVRRGRQTKAERLRHLDDEGVGGAAAAAAHHLDAARRFDLGAARDACDGADLRRRRRSDGRRRPGRGRRGRRGRFDAGDRERLAAVRRRAVPEGAGADAPRRPRRSRCAPRDKRRADVRPRRRRRRNRPQGLVHFVAQAQLGSFPARAAAVPRRRITRVGAAAIVGASGAGRSSGIFVGSPVAPRSLFRRRENVHLERFPRL